MSQANRLLRLKLKHWHHEIIAVYRNDLHRVIAIITTSPSPDPPLIPICDGNKSAQQPETRLLARTKSR